MPCQKKTAPFRADLNFRSKNMGWLTGVEPANDGITIRCLNHLTTATICSCWDNQLIALRQGDNGKYAKVMLCRDIKMHLFL